MISRLVLPLLLLGMASTAIASEKQTANEYSYVELTGQVVNFEDEIAVPTRGGAYSGPSCH